MRKDWSARDIPALEGRIAIVTGASGGVGFEVARQLARRGAQVTLASRDTLRTQDAARRIQADFPAARVEACKLDLADFSSVRSFAREFNDRWGALDILINNAGVSGGPRRQTRDGLEMLLQVNYLGHFALTGLLAGTLRAGHGARVVTVTSDVAANGRIHFDDLQAERRYGLVRTYAQSKLACLVFAVELERRAQAAGVRFTSLVTNPGIAKTDLFAAKTADWGRALTFSERLLEAVQSTLGRPAEVGALPLLFQATDPGAEAGRYVGGAKWPKPPGLAEEPFPPRSRDHTLAARLWDVSEQLTGVSFPLLAPPPRQVGSPLHSPAR